MVKLQHTIRIQAPIERCFDLARSVDVHVLRNHHCGARAQAVAGKTSGLPSLGDVTTFRARHFYLWQTLTSQITALQAPVYFQDTMVRGAFHSMRHGHYFRPLASGGTEMQDHFCFEAPVPLLGRLAEWLFLRRYMAGLLTERATVIKEVAESAEWRLYLPEEAA